MARVVKADALAPQSGDRHTLLRQSAYPKVVNERLGHSTVCGSTYTATCYPGMQDEAARKVDVPRRALRDMA